MAAAETKAFIAEMQAKYFPGSPERRGFSAPVFGELPRLSRAADAMPASALGTRFTGRGPDNVTQIHEPAVAGGGASELDTTIPTRARTPVANAMQALEKEGVKGYARGGTVSQPIGIAHEGEVVLSAADTQAAGGPEKIARAVAILKNAQRAGVPGFAAGTITNHMTGEQVQTPSQIAAASFNTNPTRINPTTGLTADQTRNLSINRTLGGGSGSISQGFNDAKRGVVNLDYLQGKIEGLEGKYKATPVQTTLKFDPLHTGATTMGIKELTNQMQTGGQAVQTQAKVSRQALGAQQGAQTSQLKSQMAQMGVQGGEAMAASANANRQQAVAQAGLEGQIAQVTAQSAQEATKELVDAGFQGQQLDLAKADFGLRAEQLQEMKDEFAAKYGLDVTALLVDASKFGIQMGTSLYIQDQNHGIDMINAMLNMEVVSYPAIEGVLKELGFEVDLSGSTNQQNAGLIATNLAAARTAVMNGGTQAEMDVALAQAWNGMHPEDPAKDSRAFRTWADSQYKTQVYRTNPNYVKAEAFVGPEGGAFGALLGFDSPEEIAAFKYGDSSGVEALKRVFTDAFTYGGFTIDTPKGADGKPTGSMTFTIIPGSDVWSAPGLEGIFSGSQINRTAWVNGVEYDLKTAFDDPTKLVNADGTVIKLASGGASDYLAGKIPEITARYMASTGTDATSFNNAISAMAAGVLKPTNMASIPTGDQLDEWIYGSPASDGVQAVAPHGSFLNIGDVPYSIRESYEYEGQQGVDLIGRDGQNYFLTKSMSGGPISHALFPETSKGIDGPATARAKKMVASGKAIIPSDIAKGLTVTGAWYKAANSASTLDTVLSFGSDTSTSEDWRVAYQDASGKKYTLSKADGFKAL